MTDGPRAPGAAGAGEVGVYVHWPYCARICPYCDFNVVRDRGDRQGQAALAAAILADLRAQALEVGPRRLVSIFFGGGTPSLMDPDWAGEIIAAAKSLFEPAADLEVTLEANPTDAEAGRFAGFADAGVDRLSLGVQSLDDAELAFLGRNHDAAEARRAAEIGGRVFPRLSLDLIYALPGQTRAAWRASLQGAVALAPEHVSAYQLTCEPGTAFERAVRRGQWSPPAADLAGRLYEATEATLGEAGYTLYEISNHARGEAARSRHNLIYWRGGDYLGLGPGAHGRITAADGTRWTTQAPRRAADYVAGAAGERTPLSPTEAAMERLLMGLRTVEGAPLAALEALQLDPQTLAAFAGVGLIWRANGRIGATRRGRSVLDRITLDLARSGRSG